MDLRALIRTVPDFPKPGIQFRDITPLLASPEGLSETVDRVARRYAGARIHHVLGIESRGFVFAAPLAVRLGAGFVPLRKAGKLPGPTFGEDFTLEYGQARLEMHRDALRPGERVLLVDDVLATGGTLAAASRLAASAQAIVVGAAVVIELETLGGRARLPDIALTSLLTY